MRSEYKELLNEAFSAPEPSGKKGFLKNIRPREVSLFGMIRQQAGYIRVTVWLFAGSVLGLESTASAVTMLVPFTAAVSVIESNRSRRFGMTELEMVTRFSLRSVVLARMTLLGAAALAVLLIISPVLASAAGEGVVLTAVRMVIPYLLTMSISLPLERSALGRKTDLCSLAVATLVTVVIYWVSNYAEGVFTGYLNVVRNRGLLITLGLLALTVTEQWKTIKKVEAFS